ncbi:MAG TPA: amino acid adenylation domain-containing protein [Longimicrobium sp.]|nr:amino acid adenylation domain-containing protein [Longimicrobium sp.]
MDTLNRRDTLSDTKRALLEARIRGAAHAPTRREAITRCAGDGPAFPMSWGQERMWFLAQLEPDNPMYNVPITVLVRADVDVPVLERALAAVVRRHEALRTVFRMVDGELRQIVMEPFHPRVEVFDVRERLSAARGDTRDQILKLAAEEGARRFDVGRLPLFRVTLLRVTDERYAMVITVHHIATDGWSYPLILREMDQFYADLARGRPHTLPEPRLRFVDYAVWQRGWLTGATLERQVAFWREHLHGAPTLALPTDRPRPPVQSYRGTFHHFRIPRELTAALHELGRREAATLNMVMMAAFYAILARYSGQDDLVVGTLLGNRNHPEIEEIIGFFVNTAALRVRLDGDPSFAELVRRTRRVILDADRHQDLPFEKLVDELHPERDPSRHPLFQAMYFHHSFVLSHKPPDEGFQTLLDAQPLHRETSISLIDTGVSKFDLVMCTVEDEGVLNALVEYATDLFDAATIRRFGQHLVTLLEQVVAHPDVPLSRLSPLEGEEREMVVAAWSGHDAEYPRHASIPALFSECAAATPGATAIIFADERVTYGELEARANRVARRLRARGVRPGDRVAVAMDRSAELIVTLLAVLKAGASYLPLDAAYPAQRLGFMLRDASAAALVVAGDVPEALAGFGGPVLSLGRDAAALAAEDASPLADTSGPEAEAYVIYTSGSTGTPKGVAVPHRAVVRLVRGADYSRYGADEVFLNLSSVAFDASVCEIWGALLNGACVVVYPPHLPTPAEIGALIRAHGVTQLFLTTGLLNQVADAGPAQLHGLRRLFSGGEAISPPHVLRLMDALPELHVANSYGPTENTTFTSHHPVRREEAEAGIIPIGRAISNTRVYVLDAAMLPCGVGIPGELYTGGDGVAHGYVNRPALTAERFVPDPFSGRAGARLYRSGDRVRWNERGELEFIGRLDEQVKVRGFRIEPGEVEAALATHPAVRAAAVVARDDGRGKQLVAYVVTAGNREQGTGNSGQGTEDGGERDGIDAAALRAHVASLLPPYMVPAAFVRIDAIPLNPNGKLDRAALPAPTFAEASSDEASQAPSSPAEERLARIWAQVLGRERVGVHENFFELGGDSILSIQMVVRATEEGLRITPRQIFQHQTVAALAAVAGTAPAVAAEQGTVTGEAPLTPVQHWFFDGDPADPHHFNMPVLLRAAERGSAEVLARAVAAVAEHHDALRIRFDRGATGWRAWNADASEPPPVDVADLSAVPDAELASAIEARADAAQRGLDLARGLFRVLLMECGPARPQRILLVVHHLVIDAVSLPIVTADLETAYRQLAAGGPVRLPAKTTAFRDWARRLADHAGSPELRKEADFWRAAIPANIPVLSADDAAAPDTQGDSAIARFELAEMETRALLHHAPAAFGAQVPELLLAALARAFERWSGSARLLVDVEAHGREELFGDVDLSRTVGWFTAIHPAHLSVEGCAGPGDAVAAVREALRAVPNRGIGFGILRWLSLEPRVRAGLRSLPKAQVSFNYLGQMDAAAPAAGSLFSPADEPMGAYRSPDARRLYRIEAEAAVWEGRLHASLVYGGAVYRHETMERLSAAWAAALRELVAHCAAPDAATQADALDAKLAALAG